MDYNFVIFGSDGGFYKTAYSDIMELNSVIYRESLWGVNNKITALIYKLYHTSRLPNRHLPFKNLLYRAISDFHFSDNRPVCFLSFGRNIHEKTYPFLFYLKRTSTGSNSISISSYPMTTTTRNDMAYCTIRPHTLPFRSKLESGRKRTSIFWARRKIALQRSSKLTKAARKMG